MGSVGQPQSAAKVAIWLRPIDVLVPPSWRDPAIMVAAVEEAVTALRANPKAAHGPGITIFRAISRLTDFSQPLPGYALDALATALGIAHDVGRRDEAHKVKRLAHAGFSTDAIAPRIDRSDRTVRRRKHDTVSRRTWASAAEVLDEVRALAHARAYEYGGDWDDDARLLIFDASKWFADSGESLPLDLWWAIACALGVGHLERVRKPDGTPRDNPVHAGLTKKAIESLWGVNQPEKMDAAARFVVRAEIEGRKRPSNREIAQAVGVTPPVVDRWVKTDKWQRTLWTRGILERHNRRAIERESDPERLVLIGGKAVPATAVRNSVRFPKPT